MLDDRAHAMQVKLCKANTRGVTASTPYLLKKKKNDKVMAIKVNKQANNGAKGIWVPKEIISNMKSTKKVWIPKRK